MKTSKRGFSLIEMLVAVSLFVVVMTISVGSLLSLVESNRKSQALKSIMNNLNFALENMSRNIRVGSYYRCNSSSNVPPNLDVPNDCSSGGKLIAFEAHDGDPNDISDQVIYRYINNGIEKSVDSGANFIAITAGEVTIEDFKFYVVGTTISDSIQPKVLMTIKGFAGIGTRTRTDFNLQTTVSQRVIDL